MKVEEVMKQVSGKIKKSEVFVSPEESLDNAALLMKENKLNQIQVVDDDVLVGMITKEIILDNVEDLNEDFFFD